MIEGPQYTSRLLRRREVEARVGRSRSSLYEMIAAGEFPPPAKIGKRAVAWVEAEIDAWVRARIAEREASR